MAWVAAALPAAAASWRYVRNLWINEPQFGKMDLHLWHQGDTFQHCLCLCLCLCLLACLLAFASLFKALSSLIFGLGGPGLGCQTLQGAWRKGAWGSSFCPLLWHF